MSDHRFHYFEKAKPIVSVVVLPIQYLVDWPVRFIDYVGNHFSTVKSLLAENAHLRQDQLVQQVELQKLLTLEKENAHLRALLSSSARVASQVLVAQLLALNVDAYDPQGVIDRGKKDGLYQGQPVLDASGVLGQIIEVGPLTSRILFISSTKSAVPVQDDRSGVRAIAIGGGVSGDLHLIYVPDTADIKNNDLFVTSGLGLEFPIGYPVGTVKNAEHQAGERFAHIDLEPSAELNRSREVLLVWPNRSQLVREVKKMLNQDA